MATTDEIVNKIQQYKEKNYLFISPKLIQGGANLVNDYNSFQLYENRKINTRNFVNEQVINLRCNENHTKKLSFNIVFCGDFDDLPDKISLSELLENQKEKIILIYSILDYRETRDYFIGFLQQETINHYKHIYLDYSLLMSLLKENEISMEISNDNQFDSIPSYYRDDTITTFVLSRIKEKTDDQHHSDLKRTLNAKK